MLTAGGFAARARGCRRAPANATGAGTALAPPPGHRRPRRPGARALGARRSGYHRRHMRERDIAALDDHQLVPRVLHEVEEPDLSVEVLGLTLEWPLVPRLPAGASWGDALTRPATGGLARLGAVDASAVTAERLSECPPDSVVAVLPPRRMAELVAEVKRLADLGVAGVGIDLAPLSDVAPFGKEAFRPRSREDLAELRAAAGGPLWVFGVGSPADAEVAAEAGADVVVVSSALGSRLRSPATI